MRIALGLFLLCGVAEAQFKSLTPLVVAPTSVTDAKGRFIEGLTAADLTVFDNGVPQKIQVDDNIEPFSVAVLIQTSGNSFAMMDKLGGAAALFTEAVAGFGGETAVLAAANEVRVVHGFTSDTKALRASMQNVRANGGGAAVLDGIQKALRMLGERAASRRKVLLVIAEAKDRSSKIKLDELLGEPALQQVSIYWLTYSPFLTPFTERPKTVWDTMTDEQKNDPKRMQGKNKYPLPEEEVLVPTQIQGGLLQAIAELVRLGMPNQAALLTHATGGRSIGFLTKGALEKAIEWVGDDVHREYIVSFEPKVGEPKADEANVYHSLRAEVRGRPELRVRIREGYWSAR